MFSCIVFVAVFVLVVALVAVLMSPTANAQDAGRVRADDGPYVVQSNSSLDAPKPYPLRHETRTPDKAMPERSWQTGSLYNWTGFYLGGHVGGAYGTSTFSDPFGTSIYGDNVRTPGFLLGVQGGYNYQIGPWVVGLEADADWMTSDGTNTCLAYSGYYVSSNCHSRPDALGTVTGRVGYAIGPLGRTLPYVKGGMAWVHNNAEINVNNLYYNFALQPAATTLSGNKLGWTAGFGVEQALSPAWSLKLEYDYLGFSGANIATSPSIFWTGTPPTKFPAGSTSSMSENFHVMKLGVNYKFGEERDAQWGRGEPATFGYNPKSGWEIEGGVRYWYSSGKFQWDNAQKAAPSTSQILQSRLTYDGLQANSGELFGRVDSPVNVFVKGNVGLGRVFSGHENDEDWGILSLSSPAYSNTISSVREGPLSYATADIGYNFLVGRDYKVGAFTGYNYYAERTDQYGCVQIANQSAGCSGAGLPTSILAGTQDTQWNSWRAGLAGEAALFGGLKLSGDVAYLPYTTFTGRDNHLGRATTTYFDQTGTGRGVQLEGILSYFVNDNFSVGIGGRYWAMWTTNGTFTCTGCAGLGVASPAHTAKYNTERYGAFLQASYKFGSESMQGRQ